MKWRKNSTLFQCWFVFSLFKYNDAKLSCLNFHCKLIENIQTKLNVTETICLSINEFFHGKLKEKISKTKEIVRKYKKI